MMAGMGGIAMIVKDGVHPGWSEERSSELCLNPGRAAKLLTAPLLYTVRG